MNRSFILTHFVPFFSTKESWQCYIIVSLTQSISYVCVYSESEDRGNCQEGRRILKRDLYMEEEQKANIFFFFRIENKKIQFKGLSTLLGSTVSLHWPCRVDCV